MSYPFFNNVLKQLNRRLKYEAAVGFAGNSFFKDASKFVDESNPLNAEEEDDPRAYGKAMAAFINSGQVKVIKREKGEGKDLLDEILQL